MGIKNAIEIGKNATLHPSGNCKYNAAMTGFKWVSDNLPNLVIAGYDNMKYNDYNQDDPNVQDPPD